MGLPDLQLKDAIITRGDMKAKLEWAPDESSGVEDYNMELELWGFELFTCKLQEYLSFPINKVIKRNIAYPTDI